MTASSITPAEANTPQAQPGTSPQAPPLVGKAWPTGRAIYAYTAGELAEGVDVYTRAMKAANRAAAKKTARSHEK